MIDWQIIDKSLKEQLEAVEQVRLQEWLDASDTHRQLYEKIRNRQAYAPDEKQFSEWRKGFSKDLNLINRRCRIRKILQFGIVAAAIVVLLIGTYWLFPNKQGRDKAIGYVAYHAQDRTNVRLTTSGGKMLEIASLASVDTLVVDGVKVTKEKQQLVYTRGKNEESGTLAVNTLEVPRGAEFRLILSDGTQVWINSATKISYPVAFTGKERKVVLEGEAYFEVTRDEKRPFVVDVNGMNVTVLGTEFNINTRNSRCVQTTLVTGSVQLAIPGQEILVLKPGQLAVTDITTGKMNASVVNTKKYTAWRQGEYFFENASIEEIMNELALWYDVEVVYRNDLVKQEKFSGCLPRSESVSSMLHKIEQTTTVHFSVQQNRIIVNN